MHRYRVILWSMGNPPATKSLKKTVSSLSEWLIIITTLILRVRPQEHITHSCWDVTWWSYAVNPSYCELIFKTAMSRREHFQSSSPLSALAFFPSLRVTDDSLLYSDAWSSLLFWPKINLNLVSFSMLLYLTNRARGAWLLNHRTSLPKNKKEKSVGKACLLCNQEKVPCSLQTLIYL